MRVTVLSALVAGLLLIVCGSASAATITVPTTADTSASQCTLRDAIHAANFDESQGACSAGSGSDLISITAFGTIALGSTLPQIESPMTITGPGDMALVTLQGDGASFRVLDVQTTSDVTISNLTVADGFANGDGGGISHTNGGELTLDNVQLTGNEAHATSIGGFASARGGGVFNGTGSALEVRNSLVSLNTVSAIHTGATGNATAAGSAVESSGPLTIERTSIVSNTSSASSENFTTVEGAVSSTGQTQIIDSGITGNSWSASATGGVGNALVNGGGLEIRPSTPADTFTLENSTVGANTGTSSGTGSALERGGGLDFNGSADGSIVSSTIAQNQANFQGANVHVNASGHTLSFENSIVAEKTGAAPNCSAANGTYSSVGHNLEDDGSPATNCNFVDSTDISGVDPVLGAPADNAGPAPTMAISESSPAADQGVSGGELTDQRGDRRPRDLTTVANVTGGDGSDIGAYEFQSTDPNPTSIDFGPLLRGSASTPQSVSVKNQTGSSLTAGAAGLSGGDAGDFAITLDICNVTLTSLATCIVNVRFSPGAATAVGAKSAVLSGGDDVSAQPYAVALMGTATAPPLPGSGPSTPPSSIPAASKKKCKKKKKHRAAAAKKCKKKKKRS
jgi:CSLREA domain-containing protein